MTAVTTAPQLADLGGLPFLDDGFAARRLLAITAAVRYSAACQRGLADGASAAGRRSLARPSTGAGPEHQHHADARPAAAARPAGSR